MDQFNFGKAFLHSDIAKGANLDSPYSKVLVSPEQMYRMRFTDFIIFDVDTNYRPDGNTVFIIETKTKEDQRRLALFLFGAHLCEK